MALQSLLQQTQTYPLWGELHPQRIAYSWTHGSGTFASRIDMIWAPVAMADLVQECEYHPSFLTDHQYLLVKCCLREHLITGPGMWKFNTSLLTDPSYVTLVNSFWSFWQTYYDHPDFHSVLDWWDQGKFYFHKLTQTFSKSKAADQHSRKSYLTCQLHILQSLFESDDRTAFTKLCEVQQELRGIALQEAKGAQVRTLCQWAEEGETSSSFFLNLESKRRSQNTMLSIPRSCRRHSTP